MNYLQQFSGLLDNLEDADLKTKLVSAFGNVKLDFNQAIEKRNAIKGELSDLKSGMSNLTGGDSIESLKEFIESNKNDGDIEKLKADLKAKYEVDTNELRNMIESEKSKFSELNSSHEKMLFNNEVEKQGLLTGFNTDNQRVKAMLLDEIKDKLILDNGVFYVKDNTTGDKSRDITSGEYLSAKSVSDGMLKASEWADFVSPEIKANGGGMSPNQNASSGKKFQDYSAAELVELNRSNPTMYQALRSAI